MNCSSQILLTLVVVVLQLASSCIASTNSSNANSTLLELATDSPGALASRSLSICRSSSDPDRQLFSCDLSDLVIDPTTVYAHAVVNNPAWTAAENPIAACNPGLDCHGLREHFAVRLSCREPDALLKLTDSSTPSLGAHTVFLTCAINGDWNMSGSSNPQVQTLLNRLVYCTNETDVPLMTVAETLGYPPCQNWDSAVQANNPPSTTAQLIPTSSASTASVTLPLETEPDETTSAPTLSITTSATSSVSTVLTASSTVTTTNGSTNVSTKAHEDTTTSTASWVKPTVTTVSCLMFLVGLYKLVKQVKAYKEKRRLRKMKKRAELVRRRYRQGSRRARLSQDKSKNANVCVVDMREETDGGAPHLSEPSNCSVSLSVSTDSTSSVSLATSKDSSLAGDVSTDQGLSFRTSCLQVLDNLDRDLALHETPGASNSALSLPRSSSTVSHFCRNVNAPGGHCQRSSSFNGQALQGSLRVSITPGRRSTVSSIRSSDLPPPPVSPRPLRTLLPDWMNISLESDDKDEDEECEYVTIDSTYEMVDWHKSKPALSTSLPSLHEPKKTYHVIEIDPPTQDQHYLTLIPMACSSRIETEIMYENKTDSKIQEQNKRITALNASSSSEKREDNNHSLEADPATDNQGKQTDSGVASLSDFDSEASDTNDIDLPLRNQCEHVNPRSSSQDTEGNHLNIETDSLAPSEVHSTCVPTQSDSPSSLHSDCKIENDIDPLVQDDDQGELATDLDTSSSGEEETENHYYIIEIDQVNSPSALNCTSPSSETDSNYQFLDIGPKFQAHTLHCSEVAC